MRRRRGPGRRARRRTGMVVGPAAERHTVVPGAEHRRTAVPTGRRTAVGPEAHRTLEGARFRTPEGEHRTGRLGAERRRRLEEEPHRTAAAAAPAAAADKAGKAAPDHLAGGREGTAVGSAHLAPGKADRAVRHRRSPEVAPAAPRSNPPGAAAVAAGRAARSLAAAAGSRTAEEAHRSHSPEEAHRSPEEGRSHNQARAARAAETSGREDLCGNQISGAPRHRRDVVSAAASARWRGVSRPSTRRWPHDRVGSMAWRSTQYFSIT